MSTTEAASPGVAAVALSELLATSALAGATVLAGEAGLDRLVERLNVMEVPDIRPWAKPREFLLTSAYPLRDAPDSLVGLVADLDAAGLAGLGIKLGRYLDALPDDVVRVADERGFPIVRLPPGVTFDEILTGAFTVILNRHAEKLARSERIHHAFLQTVLRGEGLPEIAADLADLLDEPTAILSPHGEVLASARLEVVDLDVTPPLTVDVAAGTARSGTRELTCVAVPILAGARVYGHVVALADGTASTDDDLMALENAATVAALALTTQREVQAVEEKYRSDLMHDLLRGVVDVEVARRRAAGFGWNLDRPLVAVVVRPDDPGAPLVPAEPGQPAPLAATLHQLIGEDRDPAAAVVPFSQEVVILTAAFGETDGPGPSTAYASGEERDRATGFGRLLARTAGRVVGTSLSVGISRRLDGVDAIPGAYEQASRALTIGRRIDGPGSVRHFDDLGAYRLLSLVDDQVELGGFAEEVLGALAGDDPATADLRRTLLVWLDSGGNVAETARRLHFHYHTVRYRLAKLEGLVGPFTTDGRLRLDLQLALLVRSLRHPDES